MRQILTSLAVAALIVVTASSAVAQSQPDPSRKDVPATPAPPPAADKNIQAPTTVSDERRKRRAGKAQSVDMRTQRDVTASRGSTGVAGAMCGFIVRTIAMDIATMNTSGGNSVAILQAPATAIAGAGCIGSITVGTCER